jgi:hypothetical protein
MIHRNLTYDHGVTDRDLRKPFAYPHPFYLDAKSVTFTQPLLCYTIPAPSSEQVNVNEGNVCRW